MSVLDLLTRTHAALRARMHMLVTWFGGKIGRYFPKGSLSFFVTDAQEVIDAYAHLTGGLG